MVSSAYQQPVWQTELWCWEHWLVMKHLGKQGDRGIIKLHWPLDNTCICT